MLLLVRSYRGRMRVVLEVKVCAASPWPWVSPCPALAARGPPEVGGELGAERRTRTQRRVTASLPRAAKDAEVRPSSPATIGGNLGVLETTTGCILKSWCLSSSCSGVQLACLCTHYFKYIPCFRPVIRNMNVLLAKRLRRHLWFQAVVTPAPGRPQRAAPHRTAQECYLIDRQTNPH